MKLLQIKAVSLKKAIAPRRVSTQANKKIRFVELFAGAGGLSDGFMESGCEPIAFVEQDKYCCDTLKTRLIYHQLKAQKKISKYYAYLRGGMSKQDFHGLIDSGILDKVICQKIDAAVTPKIINHIKKTLKGKKLDLLLGGPPCQSYSIIGRPVNQHKKDDERLYLYQHYFQFLKKLSPEMFVFENVPGLLTLKKGKIHEKIMKDFESLGYEVVSQTLDASDYKVLQGRKRVIIVGKKKGSVHLSLTSINHDFKVADILSDLPPLRPGSENNQYIGEPTKYLRQTKIRTNEKFVTLHEARKHNARDLEIYRIAVKAWNSSKKRIQYPDLPKALKTHHNQTSFLDRFKVVAKNLPTSHTMIAHIAKDGHYYIHPDIKQNRSLSVREAARIQSFPDNYFFEGPRTAKFTQIGNAVPPLLSKSIAMELINHYQP